MSIRPIPRSTIPIERARILRDFERRLSSPAGYVLPVQRWTTRPARAGSARCGDCAAAAVSGAGRLADRLSPAAQFAASHSRRLLSVSRAGRSVRATPCIAGPRGIHAALPYGRAGGACRDLRHARSTRSLRSASVWASRHRTPHLPSRLGRVPVRRSLRRRRRCARRWRSSRATAGSACSCRRSRRWRIISSCSRRSRRPPPSSACRCTSKAIRRRPIRAST